MTKKPKDACRHSGHSVEYMGKVAEWLNSAPVLEKNYGEFYISEVTLGFDGYTLGRFIPEDDTWEYVRNEADDG